MWCAQKAISQHNRAMGQRPYKPLLHGCVLSIQLSVFPLPGSSLIMGCVPFFFSSRTERPWDLNCWLNDKVLFVILVFRDFIFCFLTFKSWLRKVDTSLKDGSMCQTHGEAESETIRMTKKLVCFFQPPFYIRKISLLKLNYWRIGQADNISTTLKNINLLKTLWKSYLSCINIF